MAYPTLTKTAPILELYFHDARFFEAVVESGVGGSAVGAVDASVRCRLRPASHASLRAIRRPAARQRSLVSITPAAIVRANESDLLWMMWQLRSQARRPGGAALLRRRVL